MLSNYAHDTDVVLRAKTEGVEAQRSNEIVRFERGYSNPRRRCSGSGRHGAQVEFRRGVDGGHSRADRRRRRQVHFGSELFGQGRVERGPASSSARFHLMLIDTTTLKYEFAEAGDHLPRFAITPDGNVLLVDSSWTADVPARLFDVTSGTWKFIDGAPLLLDNFVITSDSLHAYVIESHFFDGLYDLDIQNGRSAEISLPFAPTNINISASDKTLYLRKDDGNVCVFSLATKSCTRNLLARAF